MKRGRKPGSVIRDNIVEILYFLGDAYGYQIYKAYKEIFPQVTLRVMYYHLSKGKDLGIFEVSEIKKTSGEYSWGPETERIFYKLGPKAEPKIKKEVKEYFDKKK